MNQSWVVLSSSSGSGLGSGNGASVLSFVVGRRFLNSCFKWPFVVAGESFSCLDMRSSVSPGQVLRGPFFIAWMNAEGTELKNVAWRNRSNYFLVLFIWKIALATCDGWLGGVSGISNRPSYFFRLPVSVRFYYYPGLEAFFCLEFLDSHHHRAYQLILKMHFIMMQKHGFILRQLVVLRVSGLPAVGPLWHCQIV